MIKRPRIKPIDVTEDTNDNISMILKIALIILF